MVRSSPLVLLALLVSGRTTAQAYSIIEVCSNLAVCSYDNLAAAVSGAADGDIIRVTEAGTYSDYLDLTGRALTIESAVGRSAVISVNSNDMIKLNSGAVVTLAGFTIGDQAKRGILVQGGSELVLDDVEIRNCTRGVDGPGLKVEGAGSSVTLVASAFTANGTTNNDNDGAHIFATSGTTVVATDTTFTGGYTEDSGAIYLDGATLTLVRAAFFDNETLDSSDGDGGAIKATNSTVTATDTVFEDNFAFRNGGAIYATGSTVTLNGGTFDGAGVADLANDGGGVYVTGGSLTVDGARFVDLDVSEEGGAVYATGSTVVSLTDVTFESVARTGTAIALAGGGLYADGATSVTLVRGTFDGLRIGGVADGRGAGAQVRNASVLAVDGTSFVGNEAPVDSGDGAGLYVQTVTTCEVTGALFQGNYAVSIGGGARINGSPCAFLDTAFVDNEGAEGGGHLAIDAGADVVDTDGLYTGGSGANGGSIWVRDAASSLSLIGTTLEASSGANGGSIYAETGDVTLSGAVLTEGAATGNGGHVYVTGDASLTIDTDPARGDSLLELGSAIDGGAVWFAGTRGLDLLGAVFSSNTATQSGGAVRVGSTAATVIDGAWFLGNEANLDGGALAWAPGGLGLGSLTVTGSAFEGNVADANADGSGDGGAIRADGGGPVTLTDSTWVGNEATDGGAVWFKSLTSLAAYRNGVCGNLVDNDGGGFYLESVNSPRELRSNTFHDNTAGSKGAAFALKSFAGGNVFNNHVVGNVSSADLGAIHLDGASVNLVNTLISHNDGVGLYATSAPTRQEYTAFYANTPNQTTVAGAVDAVADVGTAGGIRIVGVDPMLTSYTDDGDCGNDALWPLAGSPLVDAGDPVVFDVGDGSRSDIGAYGGTQQDTTLFGDGDGDGQSPAEGDCDDADPLVFVGAVEVPADGRDGDCDGVEDCWRDLDEDGFGGAPGVIVTSALASCATPGVAATADDCDDADAARNPGAVEVVADGADNDCDGDELCYDDNDLDGVGVAATVASADDSCAGSGESARSDDCDDTRSTVFPGAVEIVADARDQSCDGIELCWQDLDGDDFGSATTQDSTDLACTAPDEASVTGDCNDAVAAVKPGAVEVVADLVDGNCDGQELCYDDADGDDWGTLGTHLSGVTCSGPTDAVITGDCNDGASTINPGAVEVVADGVDQTCDSKELCHEDGDDDGYGTTGATRLSANGDLVCAGVKVSPNDDDCNDANPAVSPAAVEIPADNLDANCDSRELCYQDLDGDGQGTATTVSSALVTCTGAGISSESTDCDDGEATIFEGAPELPQDGIDQDCDGADLVGCFRDLDLDGYGTAVVIAAADGLCDDPGESLFQSDCDDTTTAISPGAAEICGDGVDQDCDGSGGAGGDDDGDGLDFATEAAIGTDDCTFDFDGDGLGDGDELGLGLDPVLADTEGDGVDDGTEVGNNPLDPDDRDVDGTIDALDPDDDGDGVLTADEDTDGVGGPAGDDSDGDLIFDYLDTDDDGDGVPTAEEGTTDQDFDLAPNYLDTDDDGDGIDTFDEVRFEGDPYSLDSDADGLSDEDEWPLDSDGDFVLDFVDVDDDGDGILSVEEGVGDVDGDTIPNALDVDSDGDGKSDLVEGTGDLDGDTIPNFVDPNDADGLTGDADGDGVTTGDEIAEGTSVTDPDSDDDGAHDGDERGATSALDTDLDESIDALDPDDDADGVATVLETGLEALCGDGSYPAVGTVAGALSYGCADGTAVSGPVSYLDTDGDTVPDYRDADDDGDGTDTFDEDRDGSGDWSDDDTDGDGTVDYLDPDDFDGLASDVDADGAPAALEEELGLDPNDSDTDGDGLSDGAEIGDPADPTDTDGDGVVDALEPDDDGDGIPTEVEGVGDTDGDGSPNHLDADADGDGVDDLDEGTADDDCDGLQNYVDADDSDGSCAPDSGEGAEELAYVPGCGCDTSGVGASGWLGVALMALLRRRRR